MHLAGFPLSSQIIGRLFALVELVRSLCDHIIAPAMLRIARNASVRQLSRAGIHFGVWVSVRLTVAFTVLVAVAHVLGKAELVRPDLEGWRADRGPAIRPVPLLARLRGNA